MTEFSKKVKKLRLEKKMTQTELAELTGVSKQSISYYEQGKKEPRLDKLKTIANVLGVTVGYLLGNETNRENSHGYSKEYIYNLLLNACHDKWNNYDLDDRLKHLDTFSPEIARQNALNDISDYCEIFKIKVPTVQEIKYDFWNDNFSFIFDTEQGKWLSITKDNLDKDVILTIVLQQIQSKMFREIIYNSKEEIIKAIVGKKIDINANSTVSEKEKKTTNEKKPVSKEADDISYFADKFYNVVNEYFDSLNE